jgi:hypothetical protein
MCEIGGQSRPEVAGQREKRAAFTLKIRNTFRNFKPA